jgi:hypothetical protein
MDSIWESAAASEKHQLFYLLFDAKLPYSKSDGYQTAESLSSTRLFEEFALTNSQYVELDTRG